MLVALTREISPAIGACELTHLDRTAIDVDRARSQHRAYERCLADRGCEVTRLPAEPGLPDSVFVEDTAVVLQELAVLARPGARSRRPEVDTVAERLRASRELHRIEPPGTLDGGDVLRVGRTLFVGRSSRTNREGLDQLRTIVAGAGYVVSGVGMTGCLHLKSAATLVADETVLVNRQWVDTDAFEEVSLIDVDPSEPAAANALRIEDAVVFPEAYVRTRERLEERGLSVTTVDVSEISKAEGGVTCCSLIFRV